MISAATGRASAAGQSPRRRWAPTLAGAGIVFLAVAACGGAGSAATPAATIASSAAPSSSPAPTGAGTAFPGIVGTAAAVSGSSLEVQNPTSGQVTVTFSASTAITETVTVTSKDVTVGSCVTVVGQPSATGAATGAAPGAAVKPVTATSVTISAPVKGTCTAAGGFGGFGRGGGGGGSSPRPSLSPRPRPSGSGGAFGRGGFGGADGKVTSVSASGFVVQGRNPAAGTDTSITVTTSATTKYLKTVTAGPSALKVGQCITAVGTANSIGAVAARSIRISQPGPNGCVSEFAGRGASGRPTADA
jgi:Domain of unknown function (DUF5666)